MSCSSFLKELVYLKRIVRLVYTHLLTGLLYSALDVCVVCRANLCSIPDIGNVCLLLFFLVRDLSILLIFSKNYLFISLIFCISFFISMSSVFGFILVSFFFVCLLALLKSSLSRFMSCELRFFETFSVCV